MARGAIALLRIVEQRESAQLRIGQAHPAREERIVLAGVRRKFRQVFLLILLQGEQRALESCLRRCKDLVAERGAKLARVGGPAQLVDNVDHRGVCHLVGREERSARLLQQRGCAAVAVETAGRRAFTVEEERGILREVLERGGVAETLHIQVDAAGRYHGVASERMIAFVTARAGDAPAGRQRRVMEDLLAERRGSGKIRGSDGRRASAIAAAGGTGGEPSQSKERKPGARTWDHVFRLVSRARDRCERK